MNDRVQKLAQELQEESHVIVELIMKNSKVSYEDAFKIWLYTKLAELILKSENNNRMISLN